MTENRESIAMHRQAMAALNAFMKMEAAGGIVLVLATVVAMIVANSALSSSYLEWLHTHLSLGFGNLSLDKSVSHWINDGLMVIFFLVVGLELKREIVEGQFADRANITLPVIGAIGGMAVPMLIYAAINWGDSAAMHGTAIPAATDIAFALGILGLLGSRVPMALKMLLLAIAVADDLGAILIIAIFYTDQLSMVGLVTAVALVAALITLNRFHVRNVWIYLFFGVLLWLAVLNSGVHATISGVVLGLLIPLGKGETDGISEKLLHTLHPWVAFVILPIFAFANAGVPIAGMSIGSLLEPVPLGIALGLFLGKQIGVFGFIWLCVRFGLAKLDASIRWASLFGMAILCGIGFTMSLFVGSLSFDAAHAEYILTHRLGILTGSFMAAVFGFLILNKVLPGHQLEKNH
ncbi:MAG: Na+/H+ antiporter NhaA [Arenimonas sp.]|nr:Na+/H+ antiporter NhaA [Arenimonas sp.]